MKYSPFIKSIIDKVLASVLLVIFAPLCLVLSILIWLKLGSPVLFCQKRPGLGGKIFTIYKFRTMHQTKDKQGNLLPDSKRLSMFGQLIRQSSLDELPQLINILKGEMSFIGPRPLLIEYLPLYSKKQARRHEVKPGITGWAQIHGRHISWEEKFALDVYYVEHMSLWLDIKIFFLTLRNLSKLAKAKPPTLTQEKFKGQSITQNTQE